MQEADKRIRRGLLKKEDKIAWVQQELQGVRVDRLQAEKEFNKHMKATYSKTQRASLSDMFEHAMVDPQDHHPFGFGHGAKYWGSFSGESVTDVVGIEAFAEMYASTMTSPESLELIKQFLPESYKIFEEILEAMNGQL